MLWWGRKRRGIASQSPEPLLHETVNGLEPTETTGGDDHAPTGMVWVDDSGAIRVKNPPHHRGSYAVIHIPSEDPPSIEVQINGTSVVGPHVVQESDEISYHLISRAPVVQMTVEVSPDGMEARLVGVRQNGVKYVLPSSSPQRELRLQPQSFSLPAPGISSAQIQAELTRAHVVAGWVPLASLSRDLDQETFDVVVARGTEPTAQINPSFEAVDLPAPLVKAGTILGRKVHGKLAQPGRTVWGTPCLRDEEQVPLPECLWGEGVAPMESGQHLVATRAGRVIWTPTFIDVLAQKVISQDVYQDLILFDGDVQIHGCVDGSRIVATGIIQIDRGVRDSELVSAAAVNVRGLVERSTVSAGVGPETQERVRHQLHMVLEGIEELHETVEDIRRHAPLSARFRLGRILAKVVQDKFTDVQEALAALCGLAQWPFGVLSPQALMLIDQLAQNLSPNMLEQEESLDRVMALAETLQHLPEVHLWRDGFPLRVVAEPSSLDHVSRSTIRVLGDLTVHEAYGTHLDVGKRLYVEGSLVGGFCLAFGVWAKVVGSSLGTETSVKIHSPLGALEAKTVHPGVVIDVAGVRQVVSRALFDVIFDSGAVTEPVKVQSAP